MKLTRHKPLKRTAIRRSTKPMRHRSAKKTAQVKARKLLLIELIQLRGNVCETKFSKLCRRIAECLHHVRKQGQGGSEDQSNLMLSCSPCNNEIEDRPLDAWNAGLVDRRDLGRKVA